MSLCAKSPPPAKYLALLIVLKYAMKMIEIVLSKAAAVSYCPFKVCFSHYASKKITTKLWFSLPFLQMKKFAWKTNLLVFKKRKLTFEKRSSKSAWVWRTRPLSRVVKGGVVTISQNHYYLYQIVRNSHVEHISEAYWKIERQNYKRTPVLTWSLIQKKKEGNKRENLISWLLLSKPKLFKCAEYMHNDGNSFRFSHFSAAATNKKNQSYCCKKTRFFSLCLRTFSLERKKIHTTNYNAWLIKKRKVWKKSRNSCFLTKTTSELHRRNLP